MMEHAVEVSRDFAPSRKFLEAGAAKVWDYYAQQSNTRVWTELSDEERAKQLASWEKLGDYKREQMLDKLPKLAPVQPAVTPEVVITEAPAEAPEAVVQQDEPEVPDAAPQPVEDAPELAEAEADAKPVGLVQRFPSTTVHRPPSSGLANKKRRMLHNQRTRETALACADIGLSVVDVHSIDDDGKCTCQYGNDKRIAEGRAPRADCGDSAGKHPRGVSWQIDATTDPEKILARWDGKPYYINVGVVFGGPTRVILVEADGPRGLETFARWNSEEEGGMPDTLECISGSGGIHCYYRVPEGWEIRNSSNAIGEKVDVRGKHGFSVADGSRHLSGVRIRLERWRWCISVDGGSRSRRNRNRRHACMAAA